MVNNKIILNLSTVITGGAGNYAFDNHRFFQKMGFDSYLIVKEDIFKKENKDYLNVFQYPHLKYEKKVSKLIRRIFRFVLSKIQFDERYLFLNTFEIINCYSASTILKFLPRNPDIIIVNWVSGFINAKLLHDLSEISNAKIFFIMMDNALLTGGCHYPWGCNGYKHNCETCPAINNTLMKNYSKWTLAYKLKYKIDNATIITGSLSDYNRVNNSWLFHSHTIVKVLDFVDENRFIPPNSKSEMKRYFGIKENKRVMFIGATYLNERRKGMKELLQALSKMISKDVVLLIAGNSDFGDIPFENKTVGYLSENDLIKAYQSADVFVCPTLEDSGPLMINQSMMCGTPVVAFEVGVAMDLVLTKITGYRAKFGNIDDLANGIDYVLSLDDTNYRIMSERCRSLAISSYSYDVYKNKISSVLEID